MIADERRSRLAEIILQRGYVSLSELTEELGASESTIRRDLEALDQAGMIRRTHGGAVAAADSLSIPAFEQRTRIATKEKRLIGRAAAALIRDGETVLIDGGTTTFEVARQLVGRPVQVVTNSLPVAALLAGDRKVDLTVVGGYVYPRTAVAVGPLARKCLTELHARRLIFSPAGITEQGMFNSNALLVETELRMMQAVDEVIVVADHTKFGQRSLVFLCELGRVHKLVSDPGLADQYRELVRNAGVELIIAGE
jgi:DeoR/GlpR family transcriptional regulator of sugar metabolism